VGPGADGSEIRRVVAKNAAAAKACYAAALRKNPGVGGGSLAVAFTIGPTGNVVETSIQRSTLADAELAACIQKTIRRLQFPVPPDGAPQKVVFPYTFKSAD
jgi:TonB family protein